MADWLRRIASVPGRESRLALWAEALRGLDAREAAWLVDDVVLGAALRDSESVAVYLPLLDLAALASKAGAAVLWDILSAAEEDELDGCLLLLRNPGGTAVAQALGPPPDPVLESLTLGHRKTAARGPRSPLLDRILKDPDPRVVGELLRNPRLREHEVLAIASRRPCPPEVFWHLVRAETWVVRPSVRRAIAFNPHAPPRLAVGMLPTLSDADLSFIAEEEVSPAALREAAARVLSWRRDAPEVVPSSPGRGSD